MLCSMFFKYKGLIIWHIPCRQLEFGYEWQRDYDVTEFYQIEGKVFSLNQVIGLVRAII